MTTNYLVNSSNGKGVWKNIDIFLMLFMLGFMMDKVVVKPVMISVALLCIGRYINWKGIFRTPLFYLIIPAFELVRFLLFQHDFSKGHIFSFIVGESYWVMALMAFIVVKTSVDRNSKAVIETTLLTFFLINTAMSFIQLGLTMYHSGSWNPYGLADPAYGGSTGDYIRGVWLAPCHINMLLNALFAVYFLYRKKYLFSFIASIVAMLTSTNFGNIIFFAVAIQCLFLLRDNTARKIISLQLITYVAFYLFLAPANFKYATSALSEHKEKAALDKKTVENAREKKNTTVREEKRNGIPEDNIIKNGKLLSFEQTIQYATSGAGPLLIGAGMGNFSSLLALRTSGLHGRERSRFFERMPEYVSEDYRQNHYKIFKAVYELPEGYHSTRNFPHSFLNQIIGEYGLLGTFSFLIFYIGYFIRRWKTLTYSIPFGVLVCGFLCFDYLFEYLSVIVVFEMFFLLDLKREESVHEPS